MGKIILNTLNLYWKLKHSDTSYDPALLAALLKTASDPEQDIKLKKIHAELRGFYSDPDWDELVKHTSKLEKEIGTDYVDTLVEIVRIVEDIN